VLVSGATGFIGSHVVDELLRAGHKVRVIGRRRSPRPAEGVEEIVFRDLADTRAIAPAFAGIDWVVHLAGRAHLTRGTSTEALVEYRRVNVEITAAFVTAAVHAGASAFVLLSSVAVLEENSESLDMNGRRRAAYSHSKREAEDALIQIASMGRTRPIVIRAPMVYGPNMKGNPFRLFRLIARGVPLPLGRIENRRSSIYVGNLTAAIRFALKNDGVHGVVHVADTEVLSTPEFIRLSAEGLGIAPRFFALPVSMLRALGKMGDFANRLVPFPVTSEAIGRLTDSVVLDTRAPYSLSGFSPPFTAEAGIRATGQWFKQRGSLHSRG
jgi:nucleoside-diphosphate-sugar epimerase